MSIRYKVVQCHLKDRSLSGKRFGKAVSLGTVTTRQLAEEEISHSTAATRSDIVAVLIELFNVLMAYLLNPMAVQLDEAGSFRVGIKSASSGKLGYAPKKRCTNCLIHRLNMMIIYCLLFEEVLDGLVGNHLLVEHISTRLWALHHLDDLRISAAIGATFVKGSDSFLCHSL
jgi:nucleoid DNA-binding protein